jgi:acyl phosphate:glycerol-3-phosphate acyltransferase
LAVNGVAPALFPSVLLGLALAYLIGAIPVGFLVARLFGGLDIRQSGSGNIGATNVLRTLGKLPAIVTLLGDIAKGYIAVSVAGAVIPTRWGAAAGAALAVIGNCWPVFLRFRGGKGMATGCGAFLALTPWATAPAALVWLVVTASFRFVSLASVMACLCLPLGVALLGYPRASVVAALVAGIIIIVRHRANLSRLASGQEPRLGERASGA